MGNAYDNASLIVTPNAYKASKIYALKPTDGSGDLAFSRAGSKMRRNSAGLWETIGTNIPPLSYPVGGGCPSWLFEAETTCLIPASNLFIGGCTKTTGITDSPISGLTSVRITKTSASVEYVVSSYSATIANATPYATSLYFKYDGHDIDSSLEFDNGGDWGLLWKANIQIRSSGITISSVASCTAVLVAEANGWYRLQVSLTSGTVTNNSGSYLIKAIGANGASFLITTSNLTQESKASSPIITAGSSVTRLADTAEGNSQITSTDFTWFIDFKSMVVTSGGSQYFGLTENGTNCGIWLFTDTIGSSFIRAFTWTSSGLYEFLISRGNANNAKIAFVKSGLQIKTFINGVLSQTSTIPVQIPIPTKIKRLLFVNNELNETITYQTALSDSEAIELTTL